jgi:ATP-dependent protease HslVU (ClpYQ) ATPase subunit
MNLPFVKVEASIYTEVGFVGRDVESMIRDLVYESINIVTKEYEEKIEDQITSEVNRIIIETLVPPLPTGATDHAKESFINTFNKMEAKLLSGEIDDRKITIEVSKRASVEIIDSNLPLDMSAVQDSLNKMLGGLNKDKIKKEVTIKDARVILRAEASEKLLDKESLKIEALKRDQHGGIIFIDEIDKSSNNDLFIHFLSMLRNKYLIKHREKTFHSIILAGLHDIKTLKLKLRSDDEQKYNSPWNIAADYKVDLSFSPTDIETMLVQYSNERRCH